MAWLGTSQQPACLKEQQGKSNCTDAHDGGVTTIGHGPLQRFKGGFVSDP